MGRPTLFRTLSLAAGTALLPVVGSAQGLTGATIEGSLTDSLGRPVPRASVLVLNTITGERWQPVASPHGRFVLEHVSAGGPYQVTARAVGYRAVTVSGVVLASGQRLRLDLVLDPSAVALDELRVTARTDPRLGPARTGPERPLDKAEIERLPNIQRNLINLGTPSPQTLRFEFNGWNSQLTAYAVDGGQGADPYVGGHTGRGVFGAPVPLEAIEEVRLLPAPYDVRMGQLASGQFALTTLRATNRWAGSAYGVFQNETLVAGALDETPFTAWSAGVAAAGPVVRDRLHLAVVADLTRSTLLDRGPLVTDTAGNADFINTGVQWESAERFRRILADEWGLDAGTLGASNSIRPRVDLWAKLSAQLGTGGVLDVSQRVATGHDEGTITRGAGPYYTGSTTRRDQRDIVETRAAWRLQPGGRWSNELVAGFRRLRSRCEAAGAFPRILALADAGSLAAGADSTCLTTDVDQTAVEVSEHASVALGRHLVTGGLHGEWFSVEDPILIGSQGTWSFASLDDLEDGRAIQYDRVLPGPLAPAGSATAFGVRSFGLYLQDRLRVGERVEVSAGLRGDRPVLPDDGPVNPAVLASLGLATGTAPAPRILWSPRIAITWNVTGRGDTWLRGGAGVFTGRPPYRWLTGIYQGSGEEQASISCTGAAVPDFDPYDQPDQCGPEGARPQGQINVYSEGLRFPQILQTSVGADQRLPGGLVLSTDLIAGWAQSQFRFTDANLLEPVGAARGEGGRPMYGAISPTRTVVTARRDTSFGAVVLVDRGQGDRTVSAALALHRPLLGRWGFEASYRWNQALDRQSLESSSPLLNLGSSPLEGTHSARALSRSLYDTRHKIFAQLTVALPLRSTLSIIHVANTGSPYSYVIDGDANADGLGNTTTGFNDLLYVPRSRSDIHLVGRPGGPSADAAYAALDSLINAEPCLRNRRGALASRNGCTNPWVQFTNARLTVAVPTRRGEQVELGADVYNLPNLLNGEWGLVHRVAPGPSLRPLRLVGWDAAAERGIYQLARLPAKQISEAVSRWRVQVTARYRF